MDLVSEEKLNLIIERKGKSLGAIFDAVPVGLMLVDEMLIVNRVNNAIRKKIGRDFKYIINNTIGRALSCKMAVNNNKCGPGECCSSCPLVANINKVFKTAQAVEDYEFESETFFCQSGDKKWFSLTIKSVVVDEKNHVVVCLNDITDRKLAEEKLAESIEIKQQFISTVSHELRTPLTAIREGLNIVLDGVAGRLKKKQQEFLQLAKRNVDRLSMLINDVLDFQKLDSGKMCFNFKNSDMSLTIKEAAETMKLMANNAKVEMSVKIDPQIGLAVFDHNRIIQVLTNLLSNAIKFTPAGGKVYFSAIRENNVISINVSDTGMGIPKEDLSKIFERFYRVKRPGKEISGTGLGLPIVSQIIARHDGTIFVESELNKGTSFTITLPQNGPNDINILEKDVDQFIEHTIN
ncbi:MAG: Alkaline phosphatase synthesis sensor protein PhoR [Elusimicrobia bacterium ADurb.Bin231]|nr:MAG: Alkaline phosphatase synthesis sensor protein PhoR [Elusimicrobia bacterium ADurb.Bin231]